MPKIQKEQLSRQLEFSNDYRHYLAQIVVRY
jgi:hypothetical protein